VNLCFGDPLHTMRKVLVKTQTVAQRRKDDLELTQLNEELEKTKKMEWKLKSSF
jgi:hypothetical protein